MDEEKDFNFSLEDNEVVRQRKEKLLRLRS